MEAVKELEAGLTGVERPQRVYYNHYLVANATHRWAAARSALEEAGRILDESAQRIDDPALREQFRTGQRVRRDIITALAAQPPQGHLAVGLARADVPSQRPPTPKEIVSLIWTVDAGDADVAIAKNEGKVALRRHRLLRLLSEAQTAGALATFADLAGALDVSDRTIRNDLAALRRQGHTVRTRGRKD
jgi:hypothetical protein